MERLLESDLIFYLVKSDEDEEIRVKFQRLRYQEYVIRIKSEPPNQLGLEKDSYDQYADYVVGINIKGEVLAGCRIIPFQEKSSLPILNAVNREINHSSFEISRFIATSDCKSILYRLIYEYAKRYEFEYAYAMARRGFVKVLCREGPCIFKKIGNPIKHKSLWLVPIEIGFQKISILIEKK